MGLLRMIETRSDQDATIFRHQTATWVQTLIHLRKKTARRSIFIEYPPLQIPLIPRVGRLKYQAPHRIALALSKFTNYHHFKLRTRLSPDKPFCPDAAPLNAISSFHRIPSLPDLPQGTAPSSTLAVMEPISPLASWPASALSPSPPSPSTSSPRSIRKWMTRRRSFSPIPNARPSSKPHGTGRSVARIWISTASPGLYTPPSAARKPAPPFG